MSTNEELPIEKVLNRLTSIKQKYSNTNELGLNQWQATCPVHNDEKQSLTIIECLDDNVVLLCSAGCHRDKITQALQLQNSDLLRDK